MGAKKIAMKMFAAEPWLAARRRRHRNRMTVLMYHEIGPDVDGVESWTVVKESDFVAQLDYLGERFDILSLDEAIRRMGADEHHSRPGAVLTFDDGDSGNASRLLPIIERKRVPVAVFVATRAVVEQRAYWFDRIINAAQVDGPVELDLAGCGLETYTIDRRRGAKGWSEVERLLRDLKRLPPDRREAQTDVVVEMLQPGPRREGIRPLTIEAVRTLSESPYVTIGAHSHCHNILTQLDRNAVRQSLQECRSLLEQWTGKRVRHLAYPNGNYDNDIISVAADLGFESGLTTVPKTWARSDSLFEIPRMGVGRYDSLDYFRFKSSGGRLF